jgi:hypothetical protein
MHVSNPALGAGGLAEECEGLVCWQAPTQLFEQTLKISLHYLTSRNQGLNDVGFAGESRLPTAKDCTDLQLRIHSFVGAWEALSLHSSNQLWISTASHSFHSCQMEDTKIGDGAALHSYCMHAPPQILQ